MLIGLLVALAAMDINVGPIMAMVGAAGFVVAFALQGTLSNFASGLMIMMYRPYDIGDVVDVAGIVGTVDSMTICAGDPVDMNAQLVGAEDGGVWTDLNQNYNFYLRLREA